MDTPKAGSRQSPEWLRRATASRSRPACSRSPSPGTTRGARGPCRPAVRHAWLTDVITEVHLASRGTYGAPGGIHAQPHPVKHVVPRDAGNSNGRPAAVTG